VDSRPKYKARFIKTLPRQRSTSSAPASAILGP